MARRSSPLQGDAVVGALAESLAVHLVAPVRLLGEIHRGIGLAQQHRRIVAVLGEHGDAEAGADLDLLT